MQVPFLCKCLLLVLLKTGLCANHVLNCVQFGWADMLQKDCWGVWIHPKPCNTLLWKSPLQLTLWRAKRSTSPPRDMHSKTWQQSHPSPRCRRWSQKWSPSQGWLSTTCRALLLSSISLSTLQPWSTMARALPLQAVTARGCQWLTLQPPQPCRSPQQQPSPHKPHQHHKSLSMAPPCKAFSLRKFTVPVPEIELYQLRYAVFYSTSCPLFGSELPVSLLRLQVGLCKCILGIYVLNS